MPTTTLLVGSLLALAAGAAYAAIGVLHARRARSHLASGFFAVFWFGVGFFGLTDGAWSLWVALAPPPLHVGEAILHLKTLAGALGFFGLLAYLGYLYRGTWAHLTPLGAFYAVAYVLLALSYVAQDPVGQEVQTWRAGLVYASPGGLPDMLIALLLFVPPIVGAVAYAMLLRHVDAPETRRRIVVTSLALGFFFGSVLFAWLSSGIPWWPPVEKLLGIATAFAVLWAQRAPPRSARSLEATS